MPPKWAKNEFEQINDRVNGRSSQKKFSPYKDSPRSKSGLATHNQTTIKKPGLGGSMSRRSINNQSFGELNREGYTHN